MAEETMRAAIFHEHGGPDVVRFERVPVPTLGPGSVRVEVRAAGLNHLDLWVRRGLPIEIEMPHIGGSDIAGVVVEAAADVVGVEPGARVVVDPSLSCGRCRWCARGEGPLCPDYRIVGEHINGGFAESVVVPAGQVHRLPDDVDFVTAAALPVSYGTAWRALVSRARLRPGEDVLVLGASGGTAIAAIQVARLCGARVFAVTGGAANTERVRALGADVVYDRLEVDFSKEIFRDTGRQGVDVVVENVGEATWKGSVRALAPNGRLVTYGATTGPRAEIDLRLLFWKQLQIIGSTMSARPEFEAMLRAAFRGGLHPVIDRVVPLDAVAEAHRSLEAGEVFGKIVVEP
jgi:NADPH:quinone reductase-like Zn-dependent oxidoreductase